MTEERKRTGAYYRGYDDAQLGAAADYGQGSREGFEDYCAGYRDGLADGRAEADAQAQQADQ